MSETLGYEAEELIGEDGYEYQHPDDRTTVAEAIEPLQADPDRVVTIVKRIAESHGWEVTTTESNDGGGRFEFTGVECPER